MEIAQIILVTGSTGTNGSLLVEELVALGAPVRALVRTPEKVSSVERKGAEAVVADFGAPETLDAALEGVERAFLVTPPDPREPRSFEEFAQDHAEAFTGSGSMV